ncbi:hypothetical protein [Amycolatopsis sp. FDAARGOS 1241]|uniref:hypothetical protein n=1 Tax=Amycolatopsis sp. FDAARGOS 1241 TaxID=2778070 RepID=UPI00194FCFF3|nr:hypothetical protein [Amycolatopsis sp. FDAARGOS 1241]QRP45922.1 hypothetical protein I6J71_43830 [Amycolatopsis sp. FDAARGOS 1241]
MAYITLPTFVGYSASSGPSRSAFVRRQRRLYEDPARAAFNYYRRAANAVRCGRAARQDEVAMRSLVHHADDRTRPHYSAIAEGWLRYLGRRDPKLVEVGRARVPLGELEVGVNPQLGLRKSTGRRYATWLYFKEEPLSRDAAQLALWLLDRGLPQILPGAEPLVVDVRRAKEFTLTPRDRERLRPWAHSEASAFMTLWDAA